MSELDQLIERFKYILKQAQFRQNYDLGEGFYSQLSDGKVKSVDDFKKKHRRKQIKDIKKLLDSRPDRYKKKK